ncbi:hypothetical protein RGF97_08020 [Streptomyces roseicoloratus]|uniref:DUF4190 domain-containing protein n=2 Tax=Streptomyces roseicoloratus TaxID=2508722 RepID=A0ABY9RS86_9ACTN|nr:hypothetical protein [Streptomyces roseicoloratus]WMX44810.1 hypothetical protein RGF97_08020 [Streptomyces roseicoloratus]
MILGIVGVVLAFCSYGILGLILGGLALIFGILGKKRADRGEAGHRGQAIAGIVLGAIGLVLGVAGIALIIYIATHVDEWEKSGRDDPWGTSLVVETRR